MYGKLAKTNILRLIMVKKCSVSNCDHSYKNQTGIFYLNPQKKKQFSECGIVFKPNLKRTYICARHFAEEHLHRQTTKCIWIFSGNNAFLASQSAKGEGGGCLSKSVFTSFQFPLHMNFFRGHFWTFFKSQFPCWSRLVSKTYICLYV